MKNLTKNSRLTDQERRDMDATSVDSMERRKRPDRRLAGLDVCVVDVTETAFLKFVYQHNMPK